MRVTAGLALAALLAACGGESPQAPGSPPPAAPAPRAVATEEAGVIEGDALDCIVMGTVAREHYGASRDDPPSRVTLDGEIAGERWLGDCDWHELGVNYVLDEGPTTAATIINYAHVSFRKPTFNGNGAAVRTMITPPPNVPDAVPSPLIECELVSGVTAWTVLSCEPVDEQDSAVSPSP